MKDYGFLLWLAILVAIVSAWRYGLKQTAPAEPAPAQPPANLPPAIADLNALTTRLHDLENGFAPFASNAAHPSALNAHPQFGEAVGLLAQPGVSLETVLQYVEGANWGLACAGLAALKRRADGSEAIERVRLQSDKLAAWSMYFALDYLADAEPRVPVGAPVVGAKDWWADNPFMPLIFRDYFARRAAHGDPASFGSEGPPPSSAQPTVRYFLGRVAHPYAAALIDELDPPLTTVSEASVLQSVGRFWNDDRGRDVLVEPEEWKAWFDTAAATLRQMPPRSLMVAGEANVGKTSFLRLLARRLAPGWTVFEAGGADLMAGQIYIGQLEGRIRSAVEELNASKKLIWYIPDLVQLARSGRHQGQSASILDQIVPAIAAGRLVIWGEANLTGVARLIQLQPSMRSLIDVVPLEPLSADETLKLAQEVISEMGVETGIWFHDGCAQVVLDTARQYVGSTSLPGSALRMLKLTAARGEQGALIMPRDVLETLAQLSGLPLSVLDTNERLDLAAVRVYFAARVIGQTEAVEAVVQRIAMLKAGLNDPGKPIGVFLFAGPTGTGKTELAKAVASFLFGSVERLIRLDMSEFQTPESIAKILGQAGAPVEANSLIDRVRKQPFSVLLLDEFEKSHPMIWDLFLQLFDEGRLTDASGQVADFRHCLVILTSNLGATAHRSLGLGFAPQADAFTTEQVMKAIAQTYRPEFQNRLDKVIVFRPLTRDLMRGILKKELAALIERRGLKDREWAIEWESSALEFLLEKGFSPEMGARPLKRAIDNYVVAPLAALIVERRFPEGEQFLFVRSDGDAIQAEFVDPDADPAAADAAAAGPLDAAEPASALSAMILAPAGTPADFAGLEAERVGIERTLMSAEWDEQKARLGEAMAEDGFWSRADRFDTLARLALMDRVKAAAETAQSLHARLARGTRSQRSYSTELVARLALQLHLVREGIRDAQDGEPVEVAFAIEPVFERAGDQRTGDRQAVTAWCRRLVAMYRAWGEKRRMHVTEQPAAGGDAPVLVVSGFGAHRLMARERGLHIWEAAEDNGGGRVAARVVVAPVPLGDIPASRLRTHLTKAIADAPRDGAVVRRYREEPPLVRSGDGRWRSGRLDLVLAGEFDLMQASER